MSPLTYGAKLIIRRLKQSELFQDNIALFRQGNNSSHPIRAVERSADSATVTRFN
jgi:hypothetical protein